MNSIKVTEPAAVEAIRYVSLAKGKAPIDSMGRGWTYLLHYRDSVLIATDDHRLHRVKITLPLENGSYTLEKNRKTFSLLSLDPSVKPSSRMWGMAEPTSEFKLINVPQMKLDFDEDGPAEGKVQALLYKLIASLGIMGKNCGFNSRHLTDAIRKGVIKVFCNGDRLIIENGNISATVMGMRL